MKKAVCFIIAQVAALCALTFFGGCSEKEKVVEVTTLEELKSASGNVKLANDIDCDFVTVSTLKGNIDGGGHTIKNAILNGNALFYSVKNLVIENVTYYNNGNNHASIVAAYREYESVYLENITVKNCTMEITQGDSPLYAGIFAAGIDKGNNNKAEFKNCRAENVKVKISGSPEKFSNIYYGGLIGYTINDVYAQNCSVSGCEAEISGKTRTMYVGGLVGGCTYGGKISNSCVNDSFLYVDAPWYTKTFGSVTGTAEVQLGGIIGRFDSSGDRFIPYEASGTISSSYVANSDIYVSSSGSSLVGGIAGYFYGSAVEQSYTCNNEITAGYYDFGKIYYNVGGLIASAKNCSVTSCFACKNKVYTEIKSIVTTPDLVSSSVITGFIPTANSVSLSYCGVGMNEIYAISTSSGQSTDERLDEFMLSGQILNCFVTSPVNAGNSRGIETVNETLWYTPQEIKNKLNLVSALWEFEADKLPYLNLK